jgi:hypothetical protein
VLALLRCHAPVPRRRGRADLGRAPPQRLLRGRRQRAEAHPRDRDRDAELQGPLRETRAEDDVGRAAFAITLERVAGDARAEEEEVVEMRKATLGAEAADVVDTLARGPLDLSDDRAIEEVRLAKVPGALLRGGHQYAAALSTWKL